MVELFRQSLHTLHSLSVEGSSLRKAYMLSDIGAANHEWPAEDAYNQAVRDLHESGCAEYAAYIDANLQLARAIGTSSSQSQAATLWLKRTSEAQTCHFAKLVNMHHHFDEWKNAIRLETLRTRATIQGRREVDENHASCFWQGKRDALLREDTVGTLELAIWQLRALLVPDAEYECILTSTQAMYFKEKIDTGHQIEQDPHEMQPLALTSPMFAPNNKPKDRPSLDKFFGDFVLQTKHEPEPETSSIMSCAPPPLSQSFPRPTVQPSKAPPATLVNARPCAATSVATSSHGRASTPRTTPLATLDDFMSDRRTPKRGPSPDLRNAKMPRSDLREELKADVADLVASQTTLKEDVTAKLSSQEKQLTDMGASVSRLILAQATWKADMTAESTSQGKHLTDLGVNIDSLRSAQDMLKADFTERLQANTDSLTNLMRALDGKLTTVRSELMEHVTQLSSQVHIVLDILDLSKKVEIFAPGQEGYLSQDCPPPPGWTQESYEAQLQRAAWSYIFYLGNPDGGVNINRQAIENTIAQFGELNSQDIVKALHHVYQKIFGRPVRELKEQEIILYEIASL